MIDQPINQLQSIRRWLSKVIDQPINQLQSIKIWLSDLLFQVAMEGEANPTQQPTPCRTGCGFYGNQASDGLCSKCYKDAVKRRQDASQAAARPSSASSMLLWIVIHFFICYILLMSESSDVELSDVEWSLIFAKKSSKRIAVEWKLARLATLSRKSSESMRSSV